jgi:hypothetical protein
MRKLLLCGIAAIAMPLPAAASCGAAFCSVNTSWDVQGAWQSPGARFDLRYEYVKQDRPMSGRREVAFGTMPRHHDEMVTRNRNLIAAVDYTVNADWGINATLPLVHRGHAHVHNHRGVPLLETWNFTGLGDARIVARYRLGGAEDARPAQSAWGLTFGAKLPTGEADVRGGGGAAAERSLQPGSGTTDAIVGAYYARSLPADGWSWFAQPQWQVPLNYYRDYRPGRRVMLDLGMRYQANDALSLMLQMNATHRKRDAGSQAEPADSGGTSVFLSPGIGYALSRGWQVYGFVQLPLYQYVNGVQIVAGRAFAVGLSSRF